MQSERPMPQPNVPMIGSEKVRQTIGLEYLLIGSIAVLCLGLIACHRTTSWPGRAYEAKLSSADQFNIYVLYPTEEPLRYRGARLRVEDIPYFKSLEAKRKEMLEKSVREFTAYITHESGDDPDRMIEVLKANGFSCDDSTSVQCTSVTKHDLASKSLLETTDEGSGHCVRWTAVVARLETTYSRLNIQGESFDCHGYTQ